MRRLIGIFSFLFFSIALLANGTVSGRSGSCQDEQADANAILELRAELQAAQNDQARQWELIESLTAQAEAANQASRLSELRANKLLKVAQVQLQTAEARAAVEAQKGAQDPSTAQARLELLGDMTAAQSQHAAAVELLTKVQAETTHAQDFYQTLKDVQANAALEDFVMSRVRYASDPNVQSPDYWIGVQCEPAMEVQVHIEPQSERLVTVKGGLKVSAVTSDSPAQSAGVIEQDVILFMNDRPTNQIEELVAMIDDNGEEPAKFYVIRQHEPITLSITPLKRPDSEIPQRVDSDPTNPRWLGYGDIPMMYGVVKPAALPSGFEADVHFAAGTNPEFSIKTADQQWTVSGDNIDQLPEPVRDFARSIWNLLNPDQASRWRLDSGRLYHALQAQNTSSPALRGLMWRQAAAGAQGAEDSTINSKLDQLQQQVNELRELVERLEK